MKLIGSDGIRFDGMFDAELLVEFPFELLGVYETLVARGRCFVLMGAFLLYFALPHQICPVIQLLLYILLKFFKRDLAWMLELTIGELESFEGIEVPRALIKGNLDPELGFRVSPLLMREKHHKNGGGRRRIRP